MKSSAKTKTSEKKSAKKSKTEASSSKDSQGQEEASAPGASSSKNQASAGNDAQAGTNGSVASESNKSSQATADTQSDAPVPAALVGTWTGTSPQATDISFTVDADGNITSKANFNVDYEPYRQSSTTAKSCSNFWKSLRLGGWLSTLLPGITGNEGELVFELSLALFLKNGTYTPVQFISDLGPTFDYSNYNAFPILINKIKNRSYLERWLLF